MFVKLIFFWVHVLFFQSVFLHITEIHVLPPASMIYAAASFQIHIIYSLDLRLTSPCSYLKPTPVQRTFYCGKRDPISPLWSLSVAPIYLGIKLEMLWDLTSDFLATVLKFEDPWLLDPLPPLCLCMICPFVSLSSSTRPSPSGLRC